MTQWAANSSRYFVSMTTSFAHTARPVVVVSYWSSGNQAGWWFSIKIESFISKHLK